MKYVTGVTLTPIGDGMSMMSSLHRASLSYVPDRRGPSALVVKTSSASDHMRFVATLFKFYAREVLFYREFAATAGIRLPQCVLAEIHPVDPEFVLVMEDISGGRTVDQIEGLGRDDASTAVDALADLHSANWGADLASHADTFIPFDSEGMRLVIPENFSTDWSAVGPKLVDEVPSEVRALCDRFADVSDDVLGAMNGGPGTVIHGDARSENLSFDDDGVLVYDFQLAAIANGAVDLGYLVSQSVRTEIAAVHAEELFTRYIARLQAGGVDVDVELARAAYCASTVFHLQIPFGMLRADGLPERADQLARTMIRRAGAEILRSGAHERFV